MSEKKEETNEKRQPIRLAKQITIIAEGQEFDFVVKRISRRQMDIWEREFGIQRNNGKRGNLMMKRAQLEDTRDKPNVQLDILERRLQEIDDALDRLDAQLDSDYKLGDGEDDIASMDAAAQARLLEMGIMDPERSALEWLDEDPQVFTLLVKELQAMLFKTMESTKSFYDELVLRLGEYEPDQEIKIRELITVIKEAYESTADPAKKKSEGAYDVSLETAYSAPSQTT